MRQKLFLIFHIFACLIAFFSIAYLCFNFPSGNIIEILSEPEFYKSSTFRDTLNDNIKQIFDFSNFQSYFEVNGSLSESKVIISCLDDGVKRDYTLKELVKISRNYGYYINNAFEVDKDDSVINFSDDTSRKLVVYRAYSPVFSPTTSLLMSQEEMSYDFITQLAKYYKFKAKFIDSPTNIHYVIHYEHKRALTEYTNNHELTLQKITSSPLYLYVSDTTGTIQTTIPYFRSNVFTLLMENNPYSYDSTDDEAYFASVIDENFTANDIFRIQYIAYNKRTASAKTAIFTLLFGILLFIISLICVIWDLVQKFKYHQTDKNSLLNSMSLEFIVVIIFVPTILLLIITNNPAHQFIRFILGSEYSNKIHIVINILICYLCFFSLFYMIAHKIANGSSIEPIYVKKNLKKFYDVIRTIYISSSPIHFFSMLFLPMLLVIIIDVLLIKMLFMSNSILCMMIIFILTISFIVVCIYIYLMSHNLSEAYNKQIKSENTKTTLITNVSHDIKTPLTSIIAYTDLLNKDMLNNPNNYTETSKNFVTILQEKSNRLKQLIDDLVEASKVSAGSISLESAKLDFVQICKQIIGEFEDSLKEKGLTIVPTFKSSSAPVYIDGNKLYRIIENLLSNIKKYSVPNTRVYLDIYEDEDYVYLAMKNVSAFPINVDPSELKERFVRGDVSRTTQGTGLGLSISSDLATLMDGNLDVVIDGDLFKTILSFRKMKQQIPEANHDKGGANSSN